MSDAEIDRLQVNQLEARYGVVRSAIYKRIEALGIKTEKVGNKAYVNAQQLRLLDELHDFIESNGTTAEFLERRGLARPNTDNSSGQSSGLSPVQSDMLPGFMAALAAEMASRLQPPAPSGKPLDRYRELEDAARNGWQLRTSEIAELLDLSISEIQQYGDRFYDAGFVFTQVGYRSQGEVAWKVSKAVK